MRILLPPSETKTAGGRGRPLRTRGDDGPLAAPRARALEALAELVTRPDAAQCLILPPAVAAAALAADAAVLDSPTTPALRRYSGVVYDGLAYSTLSPAEQRVAGRSVLIFSGLFGVVRGDEPVPDYRVPAKAVLPGLGIASTFWRPELQTVLPGMVRRELVVDLRSTDYTAMWRAHDAVAVRVLSPVRGRLAVVSYRSKLEKGRLAAELIRREAAGDRARTPDDVLTAWAAIGGAGHARTAQGLDLHTT